MESNAKGRHPAEHSYTAKSGRAIVNRSAAPSQSGQRAASTSASPQVAQRRIRNDAPSVSPWSRLAWRRQLGQRERPVRSAMESTNPAYSGTLGAMALRKICVYCASSTRAHRDHYEEARALGRLLARAGVTIVYGGGSVGSMGALADAALAEGGRLVGILPRFMDDLEWGHRSLTELRIADDIHQRKRWMIEDADAVVALPGGSGTLEELLEAITWKRLGLFVNPIVIVNARGFFDPLVALLERAIAEGFMDARHAAMWQVVDRAEEVLPAIAAAPPWSSEARRFARPGAEG
jgi:uncharacterized protein (TIGR00730 family)